MKTVASAAKRTSAARNVSPAVPDPDRALHRSAVWWFTAFLLFALWGFWPSYFSRLSEQTDVRFHAHGIALTAWCVMLIAEAYLMRARQRRLHRQTGKASYVLVPALVVATIALIHFRMSGGTLPDIAFYQFALMFNAIVAFVVLYGLAIYFRREPLLHARFMVCTIFPLFTPITDRLIYVHWPSLVPLVPALDGVPLIQLIGFALADALLAALVIWDWRARRRMDAFAASFGIVLLYHASVVTLYRFDFWRSFGYWFRSLPLS